MPNFWNWFLPLVLTIAYVVAAAYAYRWLALGARRFLRRLSPIAGDLFLYCLKWPLVLLLVLAGAQILSNLWPLATHTSHYLNNLEQVALIVVLVLVGQRWLIGSFKYSPSDSWLRVPLLRKLILIMLYTLAALMAAQSLDYNLNPILAFLGAGGFAMALGLRDVLANLFAGIQLNFDKLLAVGQSLTLENNMTGEVLGIGWMRTQMRAQDGSLLFIPNSRMIGFILQNFTLGEPEAVLTIKLPIDRLADLERAEKLALEAAGQVLGIPASELGGQGIKAHYTGLSATAAELTVTLRAHNHPAVPGLRSAYLKAVNAALAGAEIKLV